MSDLFITILNMSLSAGIVILIILLARLPLKKSPKKWSYFLWIAAAFRLCCPVSLSSAVSLFRFAPASAVRQSSAYAGRLEYIPAPTVSTAAPIINTTAPIVSTAAPIVNTTAPIVSTTAPVIGTAAPTSSVLPGGIVTSAPTAAPSPGGNAAPDLTATLFKIASIVFIVGTAAILVYGLIYYFRIRKRLVGAMLMKEANGKTPVYMSDAVDSPFILGIFRPRIYIPFNLPPSSLDYVLAHERYHLHRGDHIGKCFAFILLSLHWFNPLCWLAFYLMGKDMEMSCDEAVLKRSAMTSRAYSETLLGFANSKYAPTANPLAFGETAVKSRIKNAMNYKKPKLFITIISVILCTAVIAACALNPIGEIKKETEAADNTGETENPGSVTGPISDPETVDDAAPASLEYMGYTHITEIPASEYRYGEEGTEGVIGYLYDDAGNLGPAVVKAVGDDEFIILDQVRKQLIFVKRSGDIRTISLDSFDSPRDAAYFDGAAAILDSENIVIINDSGEAVRTVPVPERHRMHEWNYGPTDIFEFRSGRLYWQTSTINHDTDTEISLDEPQDGKVYAYILEEDGLVETDPVMTCTKNGSKVTVSENGRNWTVEVGWSPFTPITSVGNRLLALTLSNTLGNGSLQAGLYLADSPFSAAAPLDFNGLVCTPLITMSPSGRVYMLCCYAGRAELSEILFEKQDAEQPSGAMRTFTAYFNYQSALPTFSASFELPDGYELRSERSGEVHIPLAADSETGGYIYDANGVLVGGFSSWLYDADCPEDDIERIIHREYTAVGELWYITLSERYEALEVNGTCHPALTASQAVDFIPGRTFSELKRFTCDTVLCYDTESRMVLEIAFEQGYFTNDQLAAIARSVVLKRGAESPNPDESWFVDQAWRLAELANQVHGYHFTKELHGFRLSEDGTAYLNFYTENEEEGYIACFFNKDSAFADWSLVNNFIYAECYGRLASYGSTEIRMYDNWINVTAEQIEAAGYHLNGNGLTFENIAVIAQYRADLLAAEYVNAAATDPQRCYAAHAEAMPQGYLSSNTDYLREFCIYIRPVDAPLFSYLHGDCECTVLGDDAGEYAGWFSLPFQVLINVESDGSFSMCTACITG